MSHSSESTSPQQNPMTPERTNNGPSLIGSVASVSHELRAPLHAIIGLAELLMNGELTSADQELALAIHRESKALQLIVDDLLDLSQMDAGKMEIVVQPLAPRSIADEIVGLFSADATAKDLDLRIVLGDNVPLMVRADRYRLRQVLVNLVSNAIKYTNAGTVTVLVDLMADDTLRFMVSDTGPGIPDESLSNLFTPFLQSRPADRTKGTGLGLSIVHRLVKLMTGEIYVCSSETGTTFSVRVPFEVARGTSDHVVATTTSRSGRVLVVEDTEVNRVVAKSQLTRLGHRATMAENGHDALKLLTTETFDVVLMDWHMPGLDGLATARRYYEHMEAVGRDPIPIIMMTASVSVEARRECEAAGTADFLPKPVSLADLDRCLTSWLEVDLNQSASDPSSALGSPDQDQQTSSHEDSGIIERPVIDTMVHDLGGPTAVIMVIDTFVGDANKRRAILLDTQDAVSAQRAAHTLKSTTALLGANKLSATTAAIEKAFAEGAEPAPDIFATFERQLDEALHALQGISSELTTNSTTEGSL